jgi:hypothetical protein
MLVVGVLTPSSPALIRLLVTVLDENDKYLSTHAFLLFLLLFLLALSLPSYLLVDDADSKDEEEDAADEFELRLSSLRKEYISFLSMALFLEVILLAY